MNLLENKFIFNIACPLAYFLINSLCKKVKLHEVGKENILKLMKEGGMCFLWHQTLMISIYANRHKNVSTLAALSPDGSLQVYICEKLGYKCYRGSTKRNGVQGLFQLIKGLKRGEFVALTVDGPIGPKFKCQPGAAALIKKSGLPFLAVGVAIDKKYVFEKSWDQHTLPKIGSNAVIYYSEPYLIDTNLDDNEVLEFVENKIHEATLKANEILENKSWSK